MNRSSVGSGPFQGIKEVNYLFIDGNYFHNILKDVFMGFFELDKIPKIRFELLSHQFTKTFYYDTLPAQKHNQADEDFKLLRDEKLKYFEELRTINGFHVYEGITKLRRKRQMQKGVDTMIAIDMLRHSFRKNMHEAALLAGDLDFLPLLEALVMEGMYVTLWYHPNSISKDLLKSTDAIKRLKIHDLYNLLHKEDKERIKIPKMITKKLDVEQFELINKGILDDKTISLYVNEDKLYKTVYKEMANGIATQCEFETKDKLCHFVEDFYNAKIVWND